MQTLADLLGGWRGAILVSGVPAVAFASLWYRFGGRGLHYEPPVRPD